MKLKEFLKKIEKESELDEYEELIDWVDNFIEEHRSVLERLSQE